MGKTWSDPDYDEIDNLIDNDSIELGRRYRRSLILCDEKNAEIRSLREALSGILGALSVWRPVQPSPDPRDCSAGYPEFIRRAWSQAIDVLGGQVDG